MIRSSSSITQNLTKNDNEPSEDCVPEQIRTWSLHACSALWAWLVGSNDISVGTARALNHISWAEAECLANDSLEVQDELGVTRGQRKAPGEAVRVFASDELTWACLTGHSIDNKRIPKSEWSLLLGIASSKENGILQGDLCRLCSQDKRSVPKRTDALAAKGYIVKRTTLARGTRTSKLWLRVFAPSLLESGTDQEDPGPDLTLTRDALVGDLEPVPWHGRWTRDTIDFKALATTIMAITKEWGVIRTVDLKAKLGVLGSRWHMKNFAKICRVLANLGVVEYIAGKLHSKVFIDCIRFVREMNSTDWNEFLSTGKRTHRPWRFIDFSTEDLEKEQIIGSHISSRKALTTPPWSVDQPLLATIIKTTATWDDRTSSNPSISAFTLGHNFSRFITSSTAAMSAPNLQTPQLLHLQLSKLSSEKKSTFEFLTPLQQPFIRDDNIDATLRDQSNIAQTHGFFSSPSNQRITVRRISLTRLCSKPHLSRKPRQLRRRETAGEAQAPSTSSVPESTPPLASFPEKDAQVKKTLLVTLKIPKIRSKPNEATIQVSEPPQREPSPILTQGDSMPQCDSSSQLSGSGDYAQKASGSYTSVQEHSGPCSTGLPPMYNQPHEQAAIESQEATKPFDDLTAKQHQKVVVDGQLAHEGNANNDSPSSVAVPSKTPVSIAQPRRKWACTKCGRTWKNDVGLKYHLEKSKTTCNPSYVRLPTPPPRVRSHPAQIFARASEITSTPRNLRAPHPASKSNENPALEIETSAGFAKCRNYSHGSMEQKTVHHSSLFSTSSRLSSKCWGLVEPLDCVRIDQTAPHTGDTYCPKTNAGTVIALTQVVNTPKPSVRTKAPEFHDQLAPPNSSEHPEASLGLEETGCSNTATTLGTPFVAETFNPSKRKIVESVSKSQARPDEYMIEAIQHLLDENNGCLAGGQDLFKQICNSWKLRFPHLVPPTRRVCKSQLQRMFKLKLFNEHWHGFRLPSGKYKQCQIISLPEFGAFHEKILKLVHEYRDEASSKTSGLDHETETQRLPNGRRELPQEIMSLDAPVYTAQTNLNHLSSSNSQDILEVSYRTIGISREQKRRDREEQRAKARGARSWATASQLAFHSQLSTPDISSTDTFTALLGPQSTIRFLPPNTSLYDEEISPATAEDVSESSLRTSGEIRHPEVRHSSFGAFSSLLETKSVINGADGIWPRLGIEEFEMLEGGITVEGWWPGKTWLVWENLLMDVEKRAHNLRSYQSQRCKDKPTHYQFFLEWLQACYGAELARITSAERITSSRAAGPHNIFVGFSINQDEPFHWDAIKLSWPPEEQLGLKDGSHIEGQLAGRYDLSSSDDDEDDKMDLGLSFDANLGALAVRKNIHPKPHRISLKPMPFKVRRLTPLSNVAQSPATVLHQRHKAEASIDTNRLFAAFIATRALLGGVDKLIDWGLLAELFSSLTLHQLRKFWHRIRRSEKARITTATQNFQTKIISAFHSGQLPMIDFDNIRNYDWNRLLDWTMLITMPKEQDISVTRTSLDQNFHLSQNPRHDEDWGDKFFHPQASVFSRFEDACQDAAALSLVSKTSWKENQPEALGVPVVRSWIRSLCCTGAEKYSHDQIRACFLNLSKGYSSTVNNLVDEALEQLSSERFIQHNRHFTPGGRPYRLHDWADYVLQKVAHQTKYIQASGFKYNLDRVFGQNETFTISYNIDEGSMMAIMSMCAYGRIRLSPINVPHVPYGFQPSNYEVRKLPKSHYRFDLRIQPTNSYEFDENISMLQSIPSAPPRDYGSSLLPQWIDLLGLPLHQRWADILGAVCFALSTRGPLSPSGILAMLKPVLENFEMELIMQWGLQFGVFKFDSESRIAIREWWWLAVARAHEVAAHGTVADPQLNSQREV